MSLSTFINLIFVSSHLAITFLISTSLLHLTNGSTPWHLDRVDQPVGIDNAPYRPQISPRSRPILYVIDSGVSPLHKQFNSINILEGIDFVSGGNGSHDCAGHGTHVSGLATQACPVPFDLVPVRILDCDGYGSCFSMISAMEWVHRTHQNRFKNRSAVALMSVGSRQKECSSASIVAQALSQSGVLVVTAAGNSGTNACEFHPASAGAALSVGAIGILNSGKDMVWPRTNYGNCVDLFAPGVSITSAWPSVNNSAEKTLSGTSMAAPLVAAQALAVFSALGKVSVDIVRGVIETSASRGTLESNHVRTNERGSRVMLMPWKNENISTGKQDGEDGDVVLVSFKIDHVIRPSMQYMIDYMASDIEKLLEGRKGVKNVSCSSGADISKRFTRTKQRNLLVNRIRSEGSEIHFCDIYCAKGKGREVKVLLVTAFRNKHVRDIFGKAVVLEGYPIVRANKNKQTERPSKGILGLIILGICCFLTVIVLVAIFCYRRRRDRGNN